MLDRLKQLLSPGYSGRAENRTGRPAPRPEPAQRREIAPAGEDPRVRRPYTEREMAEMQAMRSARYPGDDPEYHHGGDGRDMWERVESLGSTAPVMGNPSLDPATGDMIAVSYMAGYGSDAEVGFDAIDGVDLLVTSPHHDATDEMYFESHHGGPHLAMAPGESIFRDDQGRGDMGLEYDLGPGGEMDWGLALAASPDEMPVAGSFDWTAEMR